MILICLQCFVGLLVLKVATFLSFGSNAIVKIISFVFHFSEKLQTPHSTSQPSMKSEHPAISYDINCDIKSSNNLDKLSCILMKEMSLGIWTIAEDSSTLYFKPINNPYWNLLYRNLNKNNNVNIILHLIAILGVILRYFVLFPLRIVLMTTGFGMLITNCIFTCLSNAFWTHQKQAFKNMCLLSCKIMMMGMGLSLNVHNEEHRPRHYLAVANHTSLIDGVLLSSDCYYDVVAQKQSGLINICQMLLERCSEHIFFERTDNDDRIAVFNRMKARSTDTSKAPMLIFPEGVCVNNTAVLNFKTRSFEIGCDVYPITIKYDAMYADPFWWQNRFCGLDAITRHFFHMMTSWGIKCDIYYHPPMSRRPNESVKQFAHRVKSVIVKQGNFTDLPWGGDYILFPNEKILEQKRKELAEEFSMMY